MRVTPVPVTLRCEKLNSSSLEIGVTPERCPSRLSTSFLPELTLPPGQRRPWPRRPLGAMIRGDGVTQAPEGAESLLPRVRSPGISGLRGTLSHDREIFQVRSHLLARRSCPRGHVH